MFKKLKRSTYFQYRDGNSTNLKCDNPLCDYVHDVIKDEDLKNYIDTPCPLCGDNLLTEVDYKNFYIVRTILKFCRYIPGWAWYLITLITGTNKDYLAEEIKVKTVNGIITLIDKNGKETTI